MKLLSWNTQWCCGLDGVVDVARILATARALADFDVLCLQEIAQGFDALPGAPGDQPAQLAAALPGWQLFFGAAVDELRADGQRQRFGNLIATRLPLLQLRRHLLPWPADGGVASMPRACIEATLRDPVLGAVRVLSTHLEYYSLSQRTAQVAALCALHRQALAHVAAPPVALDAGTPFQARAHTPHALLCGDFNLPPTAPEYALFAAAGLHDAWPVLHPRSAHAPTFRVFDRSHGPQPMACDSVFASDSLRPRLQRIDVDGATRASDHQPVAVTLG